MGGIASKEPQTPEGYIEKARKVQELPNKILHILFSQTDFKDILALSSLEACPTYVFTTANALETMFQKLQIQPSKGKEGEIIFAPIARLSPGLIATKESTAEQAERVKQRNRLCMDVAFFYVRIFQIYAALSLTIMNTYPTRNDGYTYVAQKRVTKGPAPAPLFAAASNPYMSGGASERGLRKQRSESHRWKDVYREVVRSNFKVLENYFTFIEKKTTRKILLHFSVSSSASSAYGSFDIEWEPNQDVLLGTYTDKKTKTESRPVRVSVEIKKYLGREVEATLFFDKDELITFIPSTQSGWVVEEGTTETEKNRVFTDYIDSYFSDFREDVTEGRPIGQKPGIGAQIKPGSIGKSPFHSFDDLKKLFESYHKGDPKQGEFPKAYCIARAMTLLNPIFDKGSNTSFRSHVCNKSLTDDYIRYMPHGGSYASANLYLRSLVALSYENYEFSNQQINLVQSAQSKAILEDASRRLASLYNIGGTDEQKKEFLTSRVAFKDFSLCGKNDATIQFINDEFRKEFRNKIVMPMLKYQSEHNEKAILLLKKMFEFEEGRLKFSREIVKGGLKVINEIAHEAFKLLINYYLSSEAYYNRGEIILLRNQGTNKFVFYS
jgi:hypothetical protein